MLANGAAALAQSTWLFLSFAVALAALVLAAALLRRGEAHARRTGSLSLF